MQDPCSPAAQKERDNTDENDDHIDDDDSKNATGKDFSRPDVSRPDTAMMLEQEKKLELLKREQYILQLERQLLEQQRRNQAMLDSLSIAPEPVFAEKKTY